MISDPIKSVVVEEAILKGEPHIRPPMPEDRHTNFGHPYHDKHKGSCEYLFKVREEDVPRYLLKLRYVQYTQV